MDPNDITAAALRVLAREGIDGWTVAAVADEAGCAKGLVHYHHKTKTRLFAEMAGLLTRSRAGHRLEPFRRHGTAALDGLWEVLLRAVKSGTTQSWVGLHALPDPHVRRALAFPREVLADTARSVATALDALLPDAAVVSTLHAALDGLEIGLLRGDPPEAARECYHRLWLGVI